MSDKEALRTAASLLDRHYRAAKKQLQDYIDREQRTYPGLYQDMYPETCKDNNGRFVLLDALTALVQARTALVNAHD